MPELLRDEDGRAEFHRRPGRHVFRVRAFKQRLEPANSGRHPEQFILVLHDAVGHELRQLPEIIVEHTGIETIQRSAATQRPNHRVLSAHIGPLRNFFPPPGQLGQRNRGVRNQDGNGPDHPEQRVQGQDPIGVPRRCKPERQGQRGAWPQRFILAKPAVRG